MSWTLLIITSVYGGSTVAVVPMESLIVCEASAKQVRESFRYDTLCVRTK